MLVNELKIVRFFVRDMPADNEDVAIVGSFISLAQSLNLQLIAKSIETEKQQHILLNFNYTIHTVDASSTHSGIPQ